MNKSTVAIVHYEDPQESIRKAVDLSHGLNHLPVNAKVFIKPNIVFWTKEVPFPKWVVITTSRVVEDMVVLNGKIMKPTPGKKKTILIGKCMYEANRGHPHIQEMIAVKGCPPSPKAVAKALHQAGIEVNPVIFEHVDKAPGLFMGKYEGKPEFEESFFSVLS
ncbi:MAG: hypothetical protein JRF35_12315 [Deltaproteobacteria bacterium]|nr:hypothetical protein [Deltaproteobacteria bacterium]